MRVVFSLRKSGKKKPSTKEKKCFRNQKEKSFSAVYEKILLVSKNHLSIIIIINFLFNFLISSY
jgi:hypothetical protein